MSTAATDTAANLAVIGAGWWAQGWHLPQLAANPHARIAAVVDSNPAPSSPLASPPLLPLAELAARYHAPAYSSLEELLLSDCGSSLDGVIISTPHATHTPLGLACLERGLQ